MEQAILHEYSASGNCYKVRLTAAHVGTPLKRREYDILKGETRTPEFLANVNANGRIPVLQIGDRFIPESNAACFYLADGSPLTLAGEFLLLFDERGLCRELREYWTLTTTREDPPDGWGT